MNNNYYSANNNESKHQHPPPPIAPSYSASSGGGGVVSGGIARSAPIRTFPTSTTTTTTAASAFAVGKYSRGIAAHLLPSPSPHAQSIPSSRGLEQSLQSSFSEGTSSSISLGIDTDLNNNNANMATARHPHGTGLVVGHAQSAITTNASHTTDPVVMTRQTSDFPIMMTRQSSDHVAIGIGGSGSAGMMNAPENSVRPQPHNTVPLPQSYLSQQPQLLTPPSPSQPPLSPTSQTTANHPLDRLPLEHQQPQSHPSYAQLQLQHQAFTASNTNTATVSYHQQPTASPSSSHYPQQQQHQHQAAISQGMQPIPQSVSPTKQQPQQDLPTVISGKQRFEAMATTTTTPLSPEEEVDFFLRGGSSTANIVATTTTTTNEQQPANTDAYKLHPSKLPSNQSLLEKCHSLALRRAWGDVVQLTKDVLMSDIGSNAGGGSGSESRSHCTLYNELLHAASSSPSSSSSGDGLVIGQPSDGGRSSTGDGMPELEEEEGMNTLQKETCEFIALRFISLLKLRRFEELRKEGTSLGLMPCLPGRQQSTATQSITTTVNTANAISNTRMERSHHSNALPNWVPFGLRLLVAQQLQFTALTNEESSQAMDVLYDLRDRAVRVEYWNTSKSLEIWRGAIDNALFNSFVRSRQWRLALHTSQGMLQGLQCGVQREVEWWCNMTYTTSSGSTLIVEERKNMEEVIVTAAHVELHSRQLLILLQTGAVSAAETIQKDVLKHAAKLQSQLQYLRLSAGSIMTALSRMTKEFALVRQVPIRVHVNEGLLQFARLKYTEAAKSFSDALHQQQRQTLDPIISPVALQSYFPIQRDLMSPALGFNVEQSLTVECVTNLSLCLLYSGSMYIAVEKLEGLIRDDPCLYLTEAVAFNLCTLYELGSDGEECIRKKKVLQRVAHRFFLHDIGVETLRLS